MAITTEPAWPRYKGEGGGKLNASAKRDRWDLVRDPNDRTSRYIYICYYICYYIYAGSGKIPKTVFLHTPRHCHIFQQFVPVIY